MEPAPREAAVNIPFFKRLKTYGPRMILDVLEERVVLDASVAPTDKNQQDGHGGTSTNDGPVQQTAVTSTAPVSSTPAANQATPPSDPGQQVLNQDLHVVLISNALGQVDAISKAAAADAKVITYDGQNGDIQTIVNELKTLVDSTGHKIEQLELLSYGQHGILQLSENSLFSADTVSSNPIPWQTLGSLLTANAKIDLFGCNIGQGADGTSLVNTISSLTHATVWASNNTTGSGPNSDWVLETHSGGSTLGSVLDANVLKTLNVTLDNSNMTNPGFETGGFTGWTQTNSADLNVVSAGGSAVFGTYGGINVTASPFYTSGSAYMARVDDWTGNGNDGDQTWTSTNLPKISQTFTYNTADHLVFAYNMCTSDGYNSSQDYTTWDVFAYRVAVTHTGVTTDIVNVSMSSGDVPPNVWTQSRESGWRTVDIDLSKYAQIGDSVTVDFSAGNTHDNAYDSWMYVDMQKTAALTQPMHTQGVLDVTVFEGSANTVRNLDNIFADSLYPSSQLTLSVSGNTNSSLFSSVNIDPTTHQLTLAYAPDAFGTGQITLHAVDPAGHTLDSTFNVTVLPVKDSPTADNEDYTTVVNRAFVVTLTGHNPDLYTTGQVGFTITSGPGHGALSNASAITTDGQGNYYETYTYTPTNNYTGPDSFSYKFTTPSGTWKGYSSGTNLSSETGYVQDMQLVDVNQNGYSELVTAASSATDGTGNTANYYFHNTGGGFGNPVQMGNDTLASDSVAVGDLDGDGHADIAILNGGTGIDRYYLWKSTGGWATTEFTAGTDLTNTTTGGAGAIAIADVNGDGLKDIIEGQAGGALKVFKNLGGNLFDNGTTIVTGLGAIKAVAVGDLNNDGFLDIVVGRNGALTQIYSGHADGTFTLATTLANSSSNSPATYSLALGDVDGDGNLDIVQGNYATTAAGINKFYKNTGNFTFSEWSITGDQDQTGAVRLADVDLDGHLEVLVSNFSTSNVYNKYYTYSFDSNTNTVSFAASNIGTNGQQFFSAASGDVNNDGFTDFVVGRWGNNATQNVLYTNQGLNTQDAIAIETINMMSVAQFNLIKNPDFSSNYLNWVLHTEGLVANAGSTDIPDTFAIKHRGDQINFLDSVTDFQTGQAQVQWSWFLQSSPLTVPGPADATNNVALHLTTAPHHAWLWQDFYIPDWSSNVKNMTMQWDMAYWNHFTGFDPGKQELALYVYDPSNVTNLQPLWISKPGDALTYSTFGGTAKSVYIPPTLEGHNVRVVFEISAVEGFMEYAVDNFRFNVAFGNPAAYSNTNTLPILASVWGPKLGNADHGAGGTGTWGSGSFSASSSLESLSSLTSGTSLLTSSLLTATDATSLAVSPLTASLTDTASPLQPVSATTTLDTVTTLLQTPSALMTAPTTTYSAVTLTSPDSVQITPDPAPTTITTTPDLLALALTPASTTPTQAGLDDPSGTAFASLDKGDSGHDYSFDLKTTLVFDLDDVSALHVLSLNAPVPINPLDLTESAILGERLSAGRSVAVSLDSMRFSDILG
jgi:hypothetical protein